MSSGPALAYSTTTSKKRSSSRIPVSASSYSGCVSTAARVLGDQVRVRELALRIAVERLEVRAGRRRVEVGVDLLDVLAVVALRAGQPEQPLLEDRVAPVPQGEREVEPATLVGDPQQAVLAPAVGARPRVVVRQVRPTRRRRPSSPRGRCPTGDRRGTGPSAASSPGRRVSPRAAGARGHPRRDDRRNSRPQLRTAPIRPVIGAASLASVGASPGGGPRALGGDECTEMVGFGPGEPHPPTVVPARPAAYPVDGGRLTALEPRR